MENSKKRNSSGSKNEIKTIYINDIESLNDSTENNETYFNSSFAIKGRTSNSCIDVNLLTNNTLEKNMKIYSKRSSKDMTNKNKDNNNNKNNKKINIIINNRDFLNPRKENINNQKFLPSSNYSDKIDNEMISKIINEKSNINMKNKTNGNKMDTIYEKKTFNYKDYKINNNLNLNLIKQKEIEMQKEIDFLKKEILLKNDIIKKLIEENKNLTEKIKLKDIELLNSKNKEENLTKVIQENNKCITNLNQLMLKIVPKNENKKNMNQKNYNNNIIHHHQSMSKSIYENNCLPRKKCSKIKLNKSKEKLNFNKENNFVDDKENKKNCNENSSVQRYFKIYTKNSIKKHLNQNNKVTNIYKDDIKANNINLNLYGNRTKKIEKNKRNNTISIELKKYNNNNSSSDFINDTVPLELNDNIKNCKNLIKNNINQKKNKGENLLIQENLSDFIANYFSRNMSCKNENNFKQLEISPKRLDTNSNVHISEISTLSNAENRCRTNSPLSNYDNYNKFQNNKKVPNTKEMVINYKNSQIDSKTNKKIPKFVIMNSDILKKINNYYSPRNKEIKIMNKNSDIKPGNNYIKMNNWENYKLNNI